MQRFVDEGILCLFGMVHGQGYFEEVFDIVIGENNKAVLVDVQNVRVLGLSKYVDLKFQLLVHHVHKKDLHVEYVTPGEMVADV